MADVTRETIDDAIAQVDAMRRADEMSIEFRQDQGIGVNAESRYADGAMPAEARTPTVGLELGDIDQLLRSHEQRAYFEGWQRGQQEAGEQLRRQFDAEIGQYVSGAFELVASDVLAQITIAVLKAEETTRTRAEIVSAVTAAVKSEAQSLREMAARARRGELFAR